MPPVFRAHPPAAVLPHRVRVQGGRLPPYRVRRVCPVCRARRAHQHRHPLPQPLQSPDRRGDRLRRRASSSVRWGRCGRYRHSPRGRQEARVSCGAIACQTDADGTPWRRCVGPSVPDRYVWLDPTLLKSGGGVRPGRGFRLTCLRTRSCPGGFHRWSGGRRPAGGRGELPFSRRHG